MTHGGIEGFKGLDDVPHLAASGRTSFAADKEVDKAFYRAAGFRVCGERAVRVDILERLADLIRPAIAYRPGVTPGEPPAGAADADGFVVTVAMTSLAGCAGEAFASILKSLGYAATQRPGPAITVPLLPKAATEPAAPVPLQDEPAQTASAPVADAAETLSEAAETASTVAADAPAPAEAAPASEITTPVEAAVETQPQETQSQETQSQDEAPVEGGLGEASPVEASVVEQRVEAVAPTDESQQGEAGQAESEGSTDTPAAEVVLIEIWRPQRHHQHGRRPERGQDRGQERGHGRRRPHSGEAPKPGQTAQGGVEAAPSGESAPTQRPPKEGDSQRPQGRPKFEGRRDDRRNEAGKPRFEGRKFDGKRRDDDRNKSQRNFSSEKREKQPDPDSPFAKLLALKAELEAKGKKG